ncbi:MULTISPECIES: VC0807 family protein [unclassified Streptomyces]|jgi:intracellular septation protein A|uniref:VC0807 family protein n=1 Tax=unclassified Streptomyces TaxID=2593676 RepID=UPI00034E439A|nr:VC0807 family protein [Streptomyces sp. HGB0020]EPD55667.1 hypothetical protein HMPREF1211_07632 [Streptomyces sp. HGB0020]
MTTKTGKSTGKSNDFLPLIVDVAIPLGSYYLFKDGFGMSTLASLACSAVVPALRTVWSVVKDRKINALAALILVVTVVSLALSFVSGDPRLLLAKDSGVSSTIAIGILVSVALGRPMMTEGLKPFLIKSEAKQAAWDRLMDGTAAASADFRRKERVFSIVWGVALLVECVVRVVGAYTVPVDTMVWLGTVILLAAIGIGIVVGGAFGAGPMERMLSEEAEAGEVAASAQEPGASGSAVAA